MRISKKASLKENKPSLRVLVGEAVIGGALALFLASFAFAAEAMPQPGQKLFEAKCAQCHGKDAKGNVKMAKVLKVDPVNVDLTRAAAVTLTTDDKVKTVTNGKNKMPKFKGKLTDEEIKTAVKYLESLQSTASK